MWIFFERVPSGADGYLMKHIHSRPQRRRRTEDLKNCRVMMSLSAELLLIERVLKAGERARRFMDLQGLVVAPGARERAEADYQTLLPEAGFSLEPVIPTTVLSRLSRVGHPS